MKTQSIDSILNQGQAFEDQEEYEKAYTLYMSVAGQYNSNIHLIERIAHVAQLLNDSQTAIEYWEKAVELNSADPAAYAQLVDLYFSVDKYKYYITRAKLKTIEGNINQSIPDYKKAAENAVDEKQTLDAAFLLAQTYELVSKPEAAIDEYQKMLAIEDNINVYHKLANLYYNHDINLAEGILKRALQVFESNINLKEKLAKILIQQNKPQEALEYACLPETFAKIYLITGENEKAFEQIEKITDQGEDYYTLLSEYYYNTKNYDKCLAIIKDLEKLNALNPLPFQMKALVYEEKKDELNALFNWGKYYALRGNYQTALNEYLNAHKIDEKQANVIVEIINVYEILNEKYASTEFMEKLARLEPENTTVMKKLAKFYTELENYNLAIHYLENVVKINKNDYASLKKLARLYEKTKNKDVALNYYKNYVNKAPLSEDTELIQKKIEELQNSDYEDDDGFFDKIINFFTKKKE